MLQAYVLFIFFYVAFKPLFLVASGVCHVMLFQPQFILFCCGKYEAVFVIVLAPGCVECELCCVNEWLCHFFLSFFFFSVACYYTLLFVIFITPEATAFMPNRKEMEVKLMDTDGLGCCRHCSDTEQVPPHRLSALLVYPRFPPHLPSFMFPVSNFVYACKLVRRIAVSVAC